MTHASEQFSELKEASGIYVVTIEMGGHSGRFLSSEQIAKAVDFLRMYEIGARHLKKFLSGAKQAFPSTLAGTEALLEQHFGIRDFIASCNEVNLTALPETDQATTATQSAIQEVIAFVDAMDNADIMSCPHEGLVRHDSRGKGARMSPAEDHAQSTSGWISDLIGMLTRRKFCIEGHADYRKHADQTPMYIGCSNDLEADIAKYTTSRIPSNINKSLQLLLSVLLLMEVDTVVKARVVLRTWEANQLQLAEQLVIALGRTVVWQDGFNSEEGGKTAGSDNSERLEAAEDYVTSSEWFKANTVATWIQGEAILKALDVGKAVFEATEGDIKAMTITRKRRQEISDVASSLPESVTGPLNEVADLLEARLARCKAEMLMDLRNAFQVAVPGIGMKEKKTPSGTQ